MQFLIKTVLENYDHIWKLFYLPLPVEHWMMTPLTVLSTTCTTYQKRVESQKIWKSFSEWRQSWYCFALGTCQVGFLVLIFLSTWDNLVRMQLWVRKSPQSSQCCCRRIKSAQGCFYDPAMVMVRPEVSQPSAASNIIPVCPGPTLWIHCYHNHTSPKTLIGCYHNNKLQQPCYGSFVITQIQYVPTMCNRKALCSFHSTFQLHTG